MLTVICGPPCAGKSTYARAHAREGDVIVDYDALATALGSARSHEAPVAVADVAYAARDAAISRLLAKAWPGWVIHSSPSAAQAVAYRDAGARVVLVDPGIDECLRRCDADRRPAGTRERIERWYAEPPDIAHDWSVR